MLNRYIKFSGRLYSQVSKITRPEFDHIFPKAKTVKNILFELDSNHTYSKLLPIYRWNYEHMDDVDDQLKIDPKYLRKVTSNDFMIMKKVLERVRQRTKSSNKHLILLENALLNEAVDRGNEDAISILAFDTLKNSDDNDIKEVEYAKKLVKHLYDNAHPLTIKLTGDLLLKEGKDAMAEENYTKFLRLQDGTPLAGEVNGYLGQINFRKPDLYAAEDYFIQSIKLARIDNCIFSYYYLSEIYMDSNPLRARSLLEVCATQGFKEAFKSLGFLEMRYFGDYDKAYEWFKLGIELNDMECFFGFFDCNVQLKDWKAVENSYIALQKVAKMSESTAPVINKFLTNRKDVIDLLDKKATSTTTRTMKPNTDNPINDKNEDRWNI